MVIKLMMLILIIHHLKNKIQYQKMEISSISTQLKLLDNILV